LLEPAASAWEWCGLNAVVPVEDAVEEWVGLFPCSGGA
jgi:hypothetical protein